MRQKTYIHLIWPGYKSWNCRFLFELSQGEFTRLLSSDFAAEMGDRNVVFVYPSRNRLPNKLVSLPKEKVWFSEVPAWRNTSGFLNDRAQVSYQSDLEPLPSKASLLTFHPFIQYGDVSNFLLVLNLIDDPVIKDGPIRLHQSKDKSLIGIEKIQTNSVTLIPLDTYGFSRTDLPVFYSPEIAGIPFGLGVNNDGSMLSLEHTHPPASFTLFGNRRNSQGQIKKRWIEGLV